MALVVHTTHGTIWKFRKTSAKRHDGASVAKREDGMFVAFDTNGVELTKERMIDVPSWSLTALERFARELDARHPPAERIFLCAACKTRFSRPTATLVTFFIDVHSDVRPVCGATCQEAAQRGTCDVGRAP